MKSPTSCKTAVGQLESSCMLNQLGLHVLCYLCLKFLLTAEIQTRFIPHYTRLNDAHNLKYKWKAIWEK